MTDTESKILNLEPDEVPELDLLIEECKRLEVFDRSDKFLGEGNDRRHFGVDEWPYGIVMVPMAWVLLYLEELKEYREEKHGY